MRLLSLLFVVSLVVAGCVAPEDEPTASGAGPDPIAEDWADLALPDEDDHDHYDAAQHQGRSTRNFEVLGWNPLETGHYGTTAGGTLCGDATDAGERRLAVVHSFTSDVAFILLDVTDATDPQVLGELVLPATGGRDVALTPDGQHVVVATTQPQAPEKPAAMGLGSDPYKAYWRSPCHDGPVPVPELDAVRPADNVPYPPGALLVDVQDPTNPIIESSFPGLVLGGHSITTGEIDGTPVAILSVTNLASPAAYFSFLGIEETPAGTTFVHYSTYNEPPSPDSAPLINGHNDGWLHEHPITGQTLAYLAHWHQGLIILDVTDPFLPKKVGHWSDVEGVSTALVDDGVGNIHETIPLDGLWNGKHYTFIGQEILGRPSASPSGWMRVLDTTDPTAPTLVADWTLPEDVSWDGSAQFSTHYLTLVDRTLFMAHYHAGVWAIDLSDLENQTRLPAIGAFLPANEPPKPPAAHESYSWTPTVMDVDALDNGDLVVFDSWSGAYVVRFDATDPAPPRTWQG